MKNKKIALLITISLSIITLTSCTKDAQSSTSITAQNPKAEDSTFKADSSPSTKETTETTKTTENAEKITPANAVTKLDGRREEFLVRLDIIQKRLDLLPEKKNSDAGITISMKSFYGDSYRCYDDALNEIYNLLKEQLSQDIMKNLEAEEINWITQKENAANAAASEFKGGTFEPVAYNTSLYNSTKARCYELVNNYMTDSKFKINANKEEYLKELANIENELLSSQEYKDAGSGTTNSMFTYADKKYIKWDEQLNKIYSLLKQQLPSDEMSKLNKEELQWITQKETKAKKSEESQGVGSQLGSVAYQASLAFVTESRCYELVYKYMK
ncbi:lysozyme inhibitor LprI family protein [Clostridium cellulovorans]|uniref:Lysozyme inhibitor LprI-like N-terminal domain-containing protein n=1 Tax=Clostridium cellulovorans (strain ATCC 35296 / DSM 3052 / OCM 3 / 743B) TaxID=573061 RepID=D9SQF9_CLOC7|nr:lysozyme inhibitor LprI family protein [Clostridium cellulovorans]ADL50226.1 hypothetical protein Clocel_0450 [Clostridium cellulovorans 743B]